MNNPNSREYPCDPDRLLYKANTGVPMSLNECAQFTGLRLQSIHDIEKRALAKLRVLLEDPTDRRNTFLDDLIRRKLHRDENVEDFS